MGFTVGSLFDGSGGFPLAAFECGGTPVWASEIEPYPIAVTKSRFPHMKHIGSVTDIKGDEVDPVDVITFGSPCQDLSVAGKRAGLKHEDNGDDETTRSGLFIEAVRIIKEMREATNGKYPRFAVWENVPGAFSSNKGEDFRIVLEELIKIVEPTAVMPAVPSFGWPYADSYCGEGWSLAYRVFDAQFWGVPQRRRRIYLVLDLGGWSARKVLFEREGLRGDFAESRTEREETPRNVEDSVGATDRERKCVAYGFDSLASNSMKSSNPHSGCRQVNIAKTLDTTDPNSSKNQGGIAIVEAVGFDGYNSDLTGDVSSTLGVNCGMSTGRNGVVVAAGFCTEHSAKSRSVGYEEEVSPTLRAGVTPACIYAIGQQGGKGGANYAEDVMPTLCSDSHGTPHAVAYAIENHPNDSRVNIDESGTIQTLTGRMGTGGGNVPMVMEEHPTFCLQGSMIGREDKNVPQGDGVNNDTSFTLNTIDRHAVAYTEPTNAIVLDRAFYNQGQNALYDPQYYEDGTVPTMVAKGPSAVCYWDGTQTCGTQTCGTLTANNANGAQRMPDKENFNCVIQTEPRYIVRRLTPTECARLQGFPDKWGHPDKKDDFTDEESRFWLDVRNTHAEINGKTVKEYTKQQMLTWYNKLHTDSSEYKMWGNGIALPCALYVMQGIGEALKK